MPLIPLTSPTFKHGPAKKLNNLLDFSDFIIATLPPPSNIALTSSGHLLSKSDH